MRELVKYVDVAIANRKTTKSLGIEVNVDVKSSELDTDKHKALSDAFLNAYPNLKMIAITLRKLGALT